MVSEGSCNHLSIWHLLGLIAFTAAFYMMALLYLQVGGWFCLPFFFHDTTTVSGCRPAMLWPRHDGSLFSSRKEHMGWVDHCFLLPRCLGRCNCGKTIDKFDMDHFFLRLCIVWRPVASTSIHILIQRVGGSDGIDG